MQTATEALARVEREANEKHVTEVRRVARMEVGQVARQGDIYLHRVAKDHAKGRRIEERQLARGVTTGSRHVADAPAKIYEGTTRPAWCRDGTLLGPVVESSRRVVVTHPEHAWLDLPAGCYQVTYQRDERTGAAVRD